MILNDDEVRERMQSPMNLLNRLKSITNKSKLNPIISIPPSSDTIIDNLQEKISIGSIKSKATAIMTAAMDELKSRMPEVQKPERLAQIASEMGKVINSVQAKVENNNIAASIVIYAPQQRVMEDYDIIDLNER